MMITDHTKHYHQHHHHKYNRKSVIFGIVIESIEQERGEKFTIILLMMNYSYCKSRWQTIMITAKLLLLVMLFVLIFDESFCTPDILKNNWKKRAKKQFDYLFVVSSCLETLTIKEISLIRLYNRIYWKQIVQIIKIRVSSIDLSHLLAHFVVVVFLFGTLKFSLYSY